MQLNVLETEFFVIVVPPEWWAEREEDGVVIGDRDDVGTIEISTLLKDSGSFDAAEIKQIAADNAEQEVVYSSAGAGDFSGVAASWRDSEAAVREWYLAADKVLLYITYCCDLDNAAMDDAAVDEILDTLQLVKSAQG